MAEFTETLTDKHIAMLDDQPVFFVATASAEGRVNLSPKGYDSIRVLGPDRVAYLDLGGSGNETHAHLVSDQPDRGRITIMACNFQRPALILRIYGHGRPVLASDPDWEALAAHFTILPGTRQIFDIHVDSVQTSCGWGVPMMQYEQDRETLKKAHRQTEPEAWIAKNQARNRSIDGLPVTPPDRYFAGAEAAD